MRRIVLVLLALGVIAAFVTGSCGWFTPPLILPGGVKLRDVSKLPYPKSAQPVDVEVEPGVFLHGVFVPADEGAPIVVHFLESSGSFTPSVYGMSVESGSVHTMIGGRQIVWELADLGFASLMVDYRGVGPSDGERDPGHVAGDAEAIYAEALRRAGGREDRLVVRGTSIGCLAAASLLEAGRRPAALSLVAPVRDETVAGHFARAYRGPVLAFFVSPFLARGLDVDLERNLEAARVPLVAITGWHDELLPADDQELLRAAVERAGGEWIALEPDDPALSRKRLEIDDQPAFAEGDHFPLTYASRHLLDGERRLLARVFPDAPSPKARVEHVLASLGPELRDGFPEDSPERAVLLEVAAQRLNDDAALLAVVVLAGCTPKECRVYLDTARPGEWTPVKLADWESGRDREATLRRLDLSDPAGRVPVGVVTSLAVDVKRVSDPRLFADGSWDLEHVLAFARGAAVPGEGGREARRTYKAGINGQDTRGFRLDEIWDDLAAKGVSEPEACRLVLRGFLKGAGIDERVVDGEGGLRLEAREGDAWVPLDPLLLLEAPPD